MKVKPASPVPVLRAVRLSPSWRPPSRTSYSSSKAWSHSARLYGESLSRSRTKGSLLRVSPCTGQAQLSAAGGASPAATHMVNHLPVQVSHKPVLLLHLRRALYAAQCATLAELRPDDWDAAAGERRGESGVREASRRLQHAAPDGLPLQLLQRRVRTHVQHIAAVGDAPRGHGGAAEKDVGNAARTRVRREQARARPGVRAFRLYDEAPPSACQARPRPAAQAPRQSPLQPPPHARSRSRSVQPAPARPHAPQPRCWERASGRRRATRRLRKHKREPPHRARRTAPRRGAVVERGPAWHEAAAHAQRLTLVAGGGAQRAVAVGRARCIFSC